MKYTGYKKTREIGLSTAAYSRFAVVYYGSVTKDSLAFLKEIIAKEAFVTSETDEIISTGGEKRDKIFDFRPIFLEPRVIKEISTLFWQRFGSVYPFQIGCIEVAGVPLMTGLVLSLSKEHKPVNGFYIRKSRKKYGLMKMVEGKLTDEKIVLVDDILNSGKSFIRQVEVLEALGKKVHAVFAITRWRDMEYYDYFHKRGIEVVSLFTLDDFSNVLPVQNKTVIEQKPVPMLFTAEWLFKSEKPNYFYVVPKSAPVLDDTKAYFGSDSGYFWALNQKDGSVAWKYKVGLHAKGKNIFSSPALYNNLVYFGSYDGNFYVLDTKTGKPAWIYMEADWIGSSPCIAEDLGIVYVGLEFGFWKKKGGIVALDAKTGGKKWEYAMPGLVHSSPAYSRKHGVVVCGSNNNVVYGFDAKSGRLLWEFETKAEVKASFAFDDSRDVVVFGSHDSHIYIVGTKTGELVHAIKTGEGIYSTPCIYEGKAYVASLDKSLYCVDLDTGAILWTFATSGRIFASPEVIEGKIYIGSNDARLYELDPHTGENTAFFQSVERITNRIAYNPNTKKFFVPTFANELYCLARND